MVPLAPQPLLSLLFSGALRGGGRQGMGGDPHLCPLSRARGKREVSKYMSEQTAGSTPLGDTKCSLGKNLLLLSPL